VAGVTGVPIFRAKGQMSGGQPHDMSALGRQVSSQLRFAAHTLLCFMHNIITVFVIVFVLIVLLNNFSSFIES